MKNGKSCFHWLGHPDTSHLPPFWVLEKKNKSASNETPYAHILWSNMTWGRVKKDTMPSPQISVFASKDFSGISIFFCATDYTKWPTLSQWLRRKVTSKWLEVIVLRTLAEWLAHLPFHLTSASREHYIIAWPVNVKAWSSWKITLNLVE